MSRFNNLNAVFAPRKRDPEVSRRANPPVAPMPVARPKQRTAADWILPPKPTDETLGQRVGFVIYCILMLSGLANEFAIRALGTKAYISTALWPILPLVLLLSGNALRGLRDMSGRVWLAFIIWLCVAAPFSVWKGGTAMMMRDYVLRCWLMFFLVTAFTVSLKHCRWLMGVLIAGDVLLLVDCAVASHVTGGRLDIPGSIFFANANDLCLQLVLATTQFFFLLFQTAIWKRVLAIAGIAASLIYGLQTGSRGGAIAMLALAVTVFLVSNQKLLIGALLAVTSLAAVVLVPAASFHRILLLSGDEPATDSLEQAALGSRMERLVLLRQSVEFTISHPLFGVGPGQFAVAVDGEAQKNGQRSSWLGTHNSYTEVSSECGIPAFLLYTAVIVFCLVSNFRMYRRSLRFPQLRQVNALAFCGFCGCVVYAVATFFWHIAYTGYLPILSGATVALRLTTSESLWGPRPVLPSPTSFPRSLARGVA